MSMGNAGPAALAFQRAASEPCHFGRGTAFVNKNKTGRIKLALKPVLAGKLYIGALLLGSVRCLFL